MPKQLKQLGLVALAAALAIAGTGCSTTDPEPESTDQTEASSPTEEAHPIVFPDCEALNPEATEANERAREEYPGLMEVSEPTMELFDPFAGEAALGALDAVEQRQGCQYPLELGTGTVMQHFIAEISDETRDRLVANLQDSDFEDGTVWDIPVFTQIQEWGNEAGTLTMHTSHAFIGPIWLTTLSTVGDFTWPGIQGVLNANPHLSTLPEPPEGCESRSGEEALDRWGEELPPAFEDPHMSDVAWGLDNAFTETYDACAMLSWIVVTVEGATGSSPNQIMLFHYGDYIGTATERAYGFHPVVYASGPNEIQVTYRWPQDGESNAESSGRSHSTFTLDPETGEVSRTGELPPY